jgi:hypothetical protein
VIFRSTVGIHAETTRKSPSLSGRPPSLPTAEKLSAEEILTRLIEEDEEHTENTRYILAVMLERQKLLRETDSQRTPNGIIRVYEHRKTGEVLIVRDPDIPLSQIESVQMEVAELLENNGRPGQVEEPEEAISETPAEVTGETEAQEDQPIISDEAPEADEAGAEEE